MLTYLLQTKSPSPHGIRIFSRSEYQQKKMEQCLTDLSISKKVSFLIGDVCDYERVKLAMKGCTHVIHAAAMKHVSVCENNPSEAIKINILGSKNVLHAAIESGTVKKVVYISTDKAVYPINLYGVTKAAAEKLFIHGNVYSPKAGNPKFSCVRYGNVVGSRGSVIPLFQKQIETGEVTITSAEMTRFWITLEHACDVIFYALQYMEGGEIYVPSLKSNRIMNVVATIAAMKEIRLDNIKIKEIGIGLGEKIHETLITEEEFQRTLISGDHGEYFMIVPRNVRVEKEKGNYSSSNNLFLSNDQFRTWIEDDLNNKKIFKGMTE